MIQIECKNITLGYEGHNIISGLSFSVSEGDYLCIVGENGSGKTTLMKTLLSLQQPVSGEVIFCNDIKSSEIGYLPQQTAVQMDFPASVWEIVLSGCQSRCGFRPFYNKNEKAMAKDALNALNIESYSKRCYRDLSGGLKQRVLLARALCAAQKILILDEPVSGLDPKASADMYKIIKQLNDNGITIIMVSHDISAALKYASHILHVGSPLFFGTTEDYHRSDIGAGFAAVFNSSH